MVVHYRPPLLSVEGMTDTRNNPMMIPVFIGIKLNKAAKTDSCGTTIDQIENRLKIDAAVMGKTDFAGTTGGESGGDIRW